MDFLIKFKSLFKNEDAFDLKKAVQEKRYFPRARCQVEARCILPNKSDVKVQIVEVSIFGMRLYCDKKIKPSEIVTLEAVRGIVPHDDLLKLGNAVKMRVIWSKKRQSANDYVSGLLYSDVKKNLQDSWVAALLKKYGVSVGTAAHKRSKIRIPADLPLSITLGTEFLRGHVRDIGISGMLIETDREMRAKDRMKFRIGPYKHLQGFHCEGKVAHKRFSASSKNWVYGIIFLEMKEKQSEILNSYLTLLCLEVSER